MTFSRTALALGLSIPLALAASAQPAGDARPGADPPASGRLGDRVAPEFQRVLLDLDPARDDYSGTVHVDLTVREATDRFRVHAEEMELRGVSLETAAGEPVEVSHRAATAGSVEIVAAALLAPGAYSLEIAFANEYGTRATGLYKSVFQGDPYLFTQFQAVDAREAFPVWDEPGFKIPWQLVLTVPEGLLAVSNAPELARTTADGRTTVTFARTQPLPSYLLAIAVGPLETVEIPGLEVPARVVVPKGQTGLAGAAVESTPPILRALEAWFGTPYPYAKLDLIAVPDFWPGAMENAGAITFADDVLLVDPEAASLGDLRSLTRTNAHELAHMWFGDLVTMEWWDDLWLNESFADWMAEKIADELYPAYQVDTFMLRGVQDIFAVDARTSTRAIRQPVARAEDALENVGLAYAKGRAVLGMVEAWLGPETFRRGVQRYLARNAGGNARGEDLWRALSEASGEDVESVLRGFLDQPGFPLVRAELHPGGEVTLSQSRFLHAGVEAPAQLWKVPVTLAWEDAEGVHARTVLLVEPSVRLDLTAGAGEVQWLVPDSDARGYYRWQLPADRLLALAERADEALDPRERIAFLGNAGSLLDAGAIGGDDYLRVLRAFADDPDPEVLAGLLDALEKVEGAFVPEELGEPFAVWVRQTLGPALDRIGRTPRPAEPEAAALLRPDLLAWLGARGRDPEVLAWARSAARDVLAARGSVDPALAGVALRLAAIDGDQELFAAYRRAFEAPRVPDDRGRYLAALASFTDERLRRQTLDYTLTGPVRPDEMGTVPFILSNASGGADLVLDWLDENWEAFTGKMVPDFVRFLAYLGGGCSSERLAEARQILTGAGREAEGIEVTLGRVAEQVEGCVALREREGDEVAAYLESLGHGAAAGSSR